MTRLALLLAVALLWWLLGPWVPVLALLSLAVPRVRWALVDARPATGWSGRRLALVAAGAVVAVTAVVLVVPDGRLGIPQGAGRLVTPAYVGRPAAARPIAGDVPRHPLLAPTGAGTAHGDGGATDSVPWRGPRGEEPSTDSTWWGVERCAASTVDASQRLVTVCAGPRDWSLRVVDPESLRPVATLDLPAREDADARPLADPCLGGALFLDDRDRAVVATADRRLLAVTTADGEGEPDLTVDESWDLAEVVPEGDCVVGLLPGWDGRLWWTTRAGRVGTLAPLSAETQVLELGEPIDQGFAVGRGGAAYVVTERALVRLRADARGRPEVVWRHVYDRGLRVKPGQPSRGSGTVPTLLPGGTVAIADNAEPRMHVVMVDAASGEERCRAAVFEDDASATASSLAAVGDAVVVTDEHGHDGPLSTALGRTTTAGVARVDADCDVAWTNDTVAAPSSGATVSRATGLAYVAEKRRSWWGASAWYLTALDVRTGRRAFSVRLGLGALAEDAGGPVRLTPDGSAYVAVLGGLVRVRDRR